MDVAPAELSADLDAVLDGTAEAASHRAAALFLAL
jgi:hypothetical protein